MPFTDILPNATVLENVRIPAQSRRHGWSLLTRHRAYRDIIEKTEALLAGIGLLSQKPRSCDRQPYSASPGDHKFESLFLRQFAEARDFRLWRMARLLSDLTSTA
jgi:hypothetical protein